VIVKANDGSPELPPPERKWTWKVYDGGDEGVSLVNNYRVSVQPILHESSYAELVSASSTKCLN